MSVTVTGGIVDNRKGLFAQESLTQSTATGEQTIAVTTELTTLSGGTASGFTIDRYGLSTATAVEGQYKTVLMLATGESKVRLGGGTATGAWVFSAADDIGHYRFLNGGWYVINTSATLATST